MGRLSRHVDAAQGLAYAHGAHDCWLWVADWVRAERPDVTVPDARGLYSTPLEGARLARSMDATGAGRSWLVQLEAALGTTAAPRAGDVAVSAASCGIVVRTTRIMWVMPGVDWPAALDPRRSGRGWRWLPIHPEAEESEGEESEGAAAPEGG